jgi:hypothetical protein
VLAFAVCGVGVVERSGVVEEVVGESEDWVIASYARSMAPPVRHHPDLKLYRVYRSTNQGNRDDQIHECCLSDVPACRQQGLHSSCR